MKRQLLSVIFILLFISSLYSQTDTTFIALKGFEDSTGTTHLYYTTKSSKLSLYDSARNLYVDSTKFIYQVYNTHNNNVNIITNGMENNYVSEDHITRSIVGDIEFIDNDPNKYIYSVNSLGIDPDGRIVRYDRNYVAGILGYFNDLYISPKNSNHIYAVAGSWIMQSFDAGLTWSDFSIEIQRNPYINYLSFSPFNDSIIFGYDNDQFLYKSNDTGKTFTKISDQRVWNSGTKLLFDSDQQHIYALIPVNFDSQNIFNAFNSLLVSENFGDDNNWKEINSTLKITNICLDDETSGEVYISVQNEVKKSTDYAQTFNSFIEEENIIRGIYKSPNGNFFVSLPNRIVEYDNGNPKRLIQYSITNALDYYPLHIGDIWQYEKAVFGGFTDTTYSIAYRKVIGDTIMPNNVSYFKILDEIKGNKIEYIRIDSSNGNVYSYKTSGTESIVDNLLMDIGDEHPMFSGTYLDSIYEKQILGMQLRTQRYSPYIVINFGSLASFEYSKDIGLTYKSILDIEVVGTVYRYQLKYAKVNGVEYGTLVGLNNKSDILQNKFRLSQNYPNPFNPTTTIEFKVPLNPGQDNVASSFSSSVVLKVFNILGKEITTLVNEKKKPGTYQVTFNASNLASGIYYYRLTNGQFAESKKMIVLK